MICLWVLNQIQAGYPSQLHPLLQIWSLLAPKNKDAKTIVQKLMGFGPKLNKPVLQFWVIMSGARLGCPDSCCDRGVGQNVMATRPSKWRPSK